jgi:phosphoribosylglycinamide formyltransferase-1
VGQTAGAELPRIGVLASGAGSNLQALIDQLHGRDVEIAAVAVSRMDAPALARARAAAIPAAAFPLEQHGDRVARDLAVADWLEARGVGHVVCAGWTWLLAPAFLRRFPQRVLNVHPSLLPAFPGLHAIEEAHAAGVAETGVTVFVVDEGVDTGRVLAQARVPVDYDEPVERLRERIHAAEHRLLPETVRDVVKRGKGEDAPP